MGRLGLQLELGHQGHCYPITWKMSGECFSQEHGWQWAGGRGSGGQQCSPIQLGLPSLWGLVPQLPTQPGPQGKGPGGGGHQAWPKTFLSSWPLS